MLTGHTLADRYGTLLAVDSHICEIMQREEHELIGVGFQALTHPDDCVRSTIVVSSLRLGEGPSVLRKRYMRPDGTSIWATVQASRLHAQDGGKIVATIQLADAGQLRRNPKGLMEAARLEDSYLQRRRLQFGEDLFSDFPWLILLQIYLAEAEGKSATIRSISDGAAMRPSLVTSQLVVLEHKRLIEPPRSSDEPLQLTDRAWKKIEHLLDRSVGD
ncbi:PAS domain S-box protein [Croceibacterium sp. TMG7-5b_MA50]|uniref:PAS domain S-box protein n=1 Tax=Croceibacterium sp. TMG7-5b_MA50 TaxID=3121290 RepID=UPI00322160BB